MQLFAMFKKILRRDSGATFNKISELMEQASGEPQPSPAPIASLSEFFSFVLTVLFHSSPGACSQLICRLLRRGLFPAASAL